MGDNCFYNALFDETLPVPQNNYSTSPVLVDLSQSKPQQEKAPRQGNYTIDEDIALIGAWIDTSMNPTVGTDQKSKTFWEKIAASFYERTNGFSNERSQKSLIDRYGDIQKAVNKFIGILAKLEKSKPSGYNELNKVSQAKTMYYQIHKSHFKFDHCWDILRNQPKWTETHGVMANKRSANVTTIPCSPSPINLDDVITESPKTPAHFVDLERPMGKKAALAKQNKRKGKETEDTSFFTAWTVEKSKFNEQKMELERERLNVYNKEVENSNEMEKARLVLEEKKHEAKRARVTLEERRDERSIMFMDLSECNDEQGEYIRLLRAEILAKKRMEP